MEAYGADWWVQTFFNWLPFVVYTIVLVVFARYVVRRQTRHFDTTKQYQEKHLGELRATREVLDRIAQELARIRPQN